MSGIEQAANFSLAESIIALHGSVRHQAGENYHIKDGKKPRIATGLDFIGAPNTMSVGNGKCGNHFPHYTFNVAQAARHIHTS